MRTYKFKTPLETLLEHFSSEELNNMNDEHAKFIDEAFIRAQASYEKAKATCPDGMSVVKHQVLSGLRELRTACHLFTGKK